MEQTIQNSEKREKRLPDHSDKIKDTKPRKTKKKKNFHLKLGEKQKEDTKRSNENVS